MQRREAGHIILGNCTQVCADIEGLDSYILTSVQRVQKGYTVTIPPQFRGGRVEP